ncbi:MAG: ABC transporter permease [Glaciecola sp.]
MRQTMNVFSLETGAEILKALRAPDFIIPTLGMPAAFYSLFAIMLPGSSNNAAYLLATYGVFGVMAPAIFGFGISVASERDRGWLDLKRASPSSAVSYIGAKICSTLIFASMSLIIIYTIAGFAAGVSLPTGTWAMMLLVHVLATFPFILIGLSIGFLCNNNAAVAISNVFFLALAALGGLWIPITIFPDAMKMFAMILPSFHLSEIALHVSGAPGERDIMMNIMAIVAITFVLLGFTRFAWSRQRS